MGMSGPLGGAQGAPRAFKALARGAHGVVDVALVAALDVVKRLAVGRVDHRQRAAGVRGDGLVGDEVLLHPGIVRQIIVRPDFSSHIGRQRTSDKRRQLLKK